MKILVDGSMMLFAFCKCNDLSILLGMMFELDLCKFDFDQHPLAVPLPLVWQVFLPAIVSSLARFLWHWEPWQT
jgi:hypothetical protein